MPVISEDPVDLKSPEIATLFSKEFALEENDLAISLV